MPFFWLCVRAPLSCLLGLRRCSRLCLYGQYDLSSSDFASEADFLPGSRFGSPILLV